MAIPLIVHNRGQNWLTRRQSTYRQDHPVLQTPILLPWAAASQPTCSTQWHHSSWCALPDSRCDPWWTTRGRKAENITTRKKLISMTKCSSKCRTVEGVQGAKSDEYPVTALTSHWFSTTTLTKKLRQPRGPWVQARALLSMHAPAVWHAWLSQFFWARVLVVKLYVCRGRGGGGWELNPPLAKIFSEDWRFTEKVSAFLWFLYLCVPF